MKSSINDMEMQMVTEEFESNDLWRNDLYEQKDIHDVENGGNGKKKEYPNSIEAGEEIEATVMDGCETVTACQLDGVQEVEPDEETTGGMENGGATTEGHEGSSSRNKKAEKWQRIRDEREKERLRRRDAEIEVFINRTKQQMRKAGKSKLEIDEKIEQLKPAILATFDSNLGGMHGKTWEDLEAGRIFQKEDKIAFTKGSLIVGVDVGNDEINARVFGDDGTELDKRKVQTFENSLDGMHAVRAWINCVKENYGKKQVIVGLEPTGHYWNNAYYTLTDFGYTVLIVNPNAVAKTKEVGDNTQTKNDSKDPRVIADLVIHGHFSVPYFPEDQLAALRDLGRMCMNAKEASTQAKNRLHAWMVRNFPELEKMAKSFESQWLKLILTNAPIPTDILALGEEGINKIFREAKLRGVGMDKASAIYAAAADSFGHTPAAEAARIEARYLAEDIERQEQRLQELERMKSEQIKKVKNASLLLVIKGVGESTLASFLGEIGNVIRFDSASQIIKLLGLVPVEASSGKHQGEKRISKRGRKRGRFFIIQMAMSVVMHAPEWTEVFRYYTTRENNRYTPNQAYIAIAAKLIRIIFMILTTGKNYNAEVLMNEFRRGHQQSAAENATGNAPETSPNQRGCIA